MFSGKPCLLNQETFRLADRFEVDRCSAIFLHCVCASGLPLQISYDPPATIVPSAIRNDAEM
jgi:hypothetical protein